MQEQTFEPQSWEPQNFSAWQARDPFRTHDVSIITKRREEQERLAYASWTRLLPPLRSQVWREREIAATLYARSREWTDVPGIQNIGVGRRTITGRRRLVAIVTLLTPLTPESNILETSEELPSSVAVPSDMALNELDNESIEVPLIVETTGSPPAPLGIVPSGQFVLASPPPIPAGWPTLQSGDAITGESPAGMRELSGTLGAILSLENDVTPLLLSSRHVLGDAGWRVIAEAPHSLYIGSVVKSDNLLDAALAELDHPWQLDYRIKTINLVPAAPVIPYSDMAVQLVGGASGHVQGYLDVVNSIPVNGQALGVIPHFRAQIPAKEGDSGSLLLSGHGSKSPIPAAFASAMSGAYVENHRCAMLGILHSGTNQAGLSIVKPQAFFVPIHLILAEFGLQTWVRDI